MHSVSVSSATVGHTLPPTDYRLAVLARRVSVSPEVAAVMASLAFGAARDHVGALPSSVSREAGR